MTNEIPANMQLTEQSKNAILAAANRLNAVCDGAIHDDACGFNKGDTDWFKYWLSRANPLKDGIIVHIHQKLRLYRKQLLRYGIDYDTLTPEFESKPEPKVADIDPTWLEFKLTFGKYKDKSIAEVVVIDRSYLEFIYVKFDDGPVREVVKAVLAGQPIASKSKPLPQEVRDKDNYIILDVEGDSKIVFHSSKNYKDEIHSVEGARWNEDKDYKWKAPINSLDEVLEAFPDAPRSEKFQDMIKRRDELKARSRAMVNTREFDLGDFGRGVSMMPFQKAGLEFMELTKGRMLLADEMGTGKSCQILSYLQLHPEIRPAIIVCPASLKFNWRNEIDKWMTLNDKVQVANRGVIPKRKIDRKTKEEIIDPDEAFTGDILIINYDILGKWADRIAAREPQFIAFDESHLLKNRNAGRTRAAKEIVKSLNIPHVIEATGTPILNRPDELYSQLHILNPKAYPEDGLSFINYAKKYCNAQQVSLPNGTVHWDTSGASNLDKLANELKNFMIRRTKNDVLKDLPEKRRSSIMLEMSNKAKYRKQIDEFGKWLMQNRGKDSAEIQAITQIEYLKQMCVEGKMDGAIEYLNDSFIATETKVIVFATHKDTINRLMKEFEGIAVKIDGSTTQAEREQAVWKFQNDPKTLVFVGNIQAAGVGLTLTAASNVAFLELGWTPALHDQAEDRAHRIGQKNAVNIYYLLAADSIDAMLMALLEHKRKIVEGSVGDEKKLNFRLFTKFYDEWQKNTQAALSSF